MVTKWPDWDLIFAETIRNILETGCHPYSLKDARSNLESYCKQTNDNRPLRDVSQRYLASACLAHYKGIGGNDLEVIKRLELEANNG